MIYTSPETATLAAQERMANEGRPRHEVIVVFPAYEGGFKIGTWPSTTVNEMPEGAWIVRLP
jgi:hypothetical protein